MTLDLSPNCTQRIQTRAKGNYSFHWKLRRVRALILIYLDSQLAIFDFGHLQGVNWGQSWTKNSNVYIPCLCKNSSFSKCFKYYMYNYEDYLWSEFQFNMMLFTEVIAQNTLKWTHRLLNQKKRGASSR